MNSRYRFALQLLIVSLIPVGCNDSSSRNNSIANVEKTRIIGQKDFTSRPANGNSLTSAPLLTAGAIEDKSVSPASNQTTARTIQETDIYRLDGDRLYYLNSYRGLMVFDVTNVDKPQLIGRSPIYGDPIEMIVHDGIASVVVSDWYGTTAEGKPFHGSIVRGIDVSNPSQMKIIGEATLGGWVRDIRVVGDVLYAVSEQYPWDSSWYGNGTIATTNQTTVAVTSVNLANGQIKFIDRYENSGQSGIFNVTEKAILLASNTTVVSSPDNPGRMELKYLDISDPAGDIQERGKFTLTGTLQGWGADNGRWNIDFADGKTAHVIACAGDYCGSGQGLILGIVDFTNPDAPLARSLLNIPSTSWSPTVRFDAGRMYLAPSDSSCYSADNTSTETPVVIYDLTDSDAPQLAGSAHISGKVWLFMPAQNRLFALGNDCNNKDYSNNIALGYLDVTDPAAPHVIDVANFGNGWAWTPAAGTFKAFTKNDAEGLVVLPFSGWDSTSYQYNNGVQLIEFSPNTINSAGATQNHGWVERGIFVKNRIVALSDLSLAVIDYSDHYKPVVVSELTLARNVVDVKPQGTTVAELSSDFWENDHQHSTLRILPIAQAEENISDVALAEIQIDGYNPQIFHNGTFSYLVSNIEYQTPCETSDAQTGADGSKVIAAYNPGICSAWTQRVQIVERTASAVLKRGVIELPTIKNYWYGGWGWFGCYDWNWYQGADIIQVDGNALVFRRWQPWYFRNNTDGNASTSLYVVDLSLPDQPSIASTTITNDLNSWWGNLRAVGDKLYAGHYEWVEQPLYNETTNDPGVVKYYLDQIDLSDRANPRVGKKINVPGILVGADENDPSIIFTMDYRWDNERNTNRLEVLQLQDESASWLGGLDIPGQVGNTFIQGSTAYMTVQEFDPGTASYSLALYQIDLAKPTQPVALPSVNMSGWGWLLGVQGDRALVTSGWGDAGIDVFRLQSGQAPIFDRFIRSRGWWTNSIARQENQLFLASGYWGTQVIDLE